MSEKRDQVAVQCRAVSHMAKAIAKVHDDYAGIEHAGIMESLLDEVGWQTAELMEDLGDMLNGMDAVTETKA